MNSSIDTIIKQAMLDAGIQPKLEKEAAKKTGNELADSLYKLAEQLESVGDVPVGAQKAASGDNHLRDLTKAYLFQRMLKRAVEDRLGVSSDDNVVEKVASEVCLKGEYLEAFEKRAGLENQSHPFKSVKVLADADRGVQT